MEAEDRKRKKPQKKAGKERPICEDARIILGCNPATEIVLRHRCSCEKISCEQMVAARVDVSQVEARINDRADTITDWSTVILIWPKARPSPSRKAGLGPNEAATEKHDLVRSNIFRAIVMTKWSSRLGREYAETSKRTSTRMSLLRRRLRGVSAP